MDLIKKYLGDVMVVTGAGVLVYATWQWSSIAGWYVLGVMVMGAGIIYEMAAMKRGTK